MLQANKIRKLVTALAVAGLLIMVASCIQAAPIFLVGDTGNNTIFQFTADGTWSQFIKDDINCSGPAGMAFDKNHMLYVASQNSNAILRYGPDGHFDKYIFLDPTKMSWPEGLAIGPDGKIYVSAGEQNVIIRILPDGNSSETYDGIYASGNGLNVPAGIEFDSQGRLYVASYVGDQILRWKANGEFDKVIADLDSAFDVAIGPDGRVYVVGMWSNKFQRYTSEGVLESDIVADPGYTLTSVVPNPDAAATYGVIVASMYHGVMKMDDPLYWYYGYTRVVNPTYNSGPIANARYLVTAPGSNKLSGHVDLQDYAGDITKVDLSVQLIKADGAVDTDSTVRLNADGNFTMHFVQDGTFGVRIKAANWIGDITPLVTMGADTNIGNITLLNGDCNGDNSVTILDFGIMKAAWGTTPESSKWDSRADLNGDGSVSISDFGIMKKNWGKSGDL